MSEAVSMYGYKVNRSGFMCCPFHGEKTPSLKIYEGDRGWYCFGCHRGGTVIDFVMNLFDLSFHDAIQKLGTDFNVPQESGSRDDVERMIREKVLRRKVEREREEAKRRVSEEYQSAKRFMSEATEWSPELENAIQIVSDYERRFDNGDL